ncbi:MAG: branched-chain amino acid ABC transporter permease [Candidatus Bathyarchaeia archaeon]
MDIGLAVEIVLNGLLLGGIYSFMALGLSLIFGVSGILNITHGEFLMFGGLASYLVFTSLRINPFLLMVIIPPIFLAIGFLFEILFVRPISARPHHALLVSSILVTFGLALIFEDVTAFLGGGVPKGIAFSVPPIIIANIRMSSIRLIALVTVTALVGMLWVYLKKTYIGKASRAIIQDREGAILMGVNISKISMITFGIGTALAAMSGIFFAMLLSVYSAMGLPLTLICLCIIILGGVGNIVGTLISGIMVGIFEVLVGFTWGLSWSPAVPILILILVLMVRPEGLFRRG